MNLAAHGSTARDRPPAALTSPARPPTRPASANAQSTVVRSHGGTSSSYGRYVCVPPPMNTLAEPSATAAPQVILSPLRAAGLLLMKTPPDPCAMSGTGLCLLHATVLAMANAASLPLTKTLVEPVRIVPVVDVNHRLLPIASPNPRIALAPTPAARPASSATPNPQVNVAKATAAISATPSTAPIRNPVSALVCSIGSVTRAASNMVSLPLSPGGSSGCPTGCPAIGSRRAMRARTPRRPRRARPGSMP